MPRIEGVSQPKAGLLVRFAYWFSRRRYGQVPAPLTVIAHHPWLFRGYGAFEFAFDRSHLVDGRLKLLAQIKAAALIGCPF